MASTAETRRLVINADDFGMTEGINRGILEAYSAGTLTSASLMPTMPAFEDAVRLARAVRGGLGVGLHFTLTAGRPLSAADGLTDPVTGSFLSHARLVTRALRGRLRARELETECAAQIARCEAAGIRLTHIDGHHHAHALPVVRDAVRRVALSAGIRFVRRPVEPLGGAELPLRRLPARVGLRLLARGSASQAAPELRHADHFRGPSLLGATRLAERLVELFDALPPGTTELMVHPGHVDGPLPGHDSYTMGRGRELAALCSAAVRARLDAGDITLVHFGQL